MKLSKLTLRPYQTEDVESIETAWKDFRAVLYQLPTGGGKSVVLSKIIGDYREEKILILAHKRRLLMQMQTHLQNIGVKTGLLIAQREENMESNVVIASIRTAVKSRRLEMLIARHWDRVIIDEARHSRTGSYDIVLDRLLQVHPQHKLLGVDATPYRKDKKRLDKHFQTLVVSAENIKSLQEKGFLAKEKIYATPIGEIEKQVKEVANDYQQTELSNYMRQAKYLNYVVDAYTKFGEKRQALVFAVDKAHSKDLLKVFKEKGYDSVAQIDSDLSEAEVDKVYRDYENGDVQILINVEMLTEGVDLPETGCIIGARPTKSLTLYLQMAGRGTRPKSDSSDLIIIDCAGWTEEFGSISSPREWSLDPDVDPNDPRKKNRIVGKNKEGKLTTDLDEMDEFTELVEMTPEQYISQVEGGMKAAEKQNQTVDQKIKQVQDDLAELLHKAAVQGLKDKVSPFVGIVQRDRYDKDVLVAYFFHKTRAIRKKKRDSDEEVDAWEDGSHVVEMNLGKRELMYAKLDDDLLTNGWQRRGEDKKSVKEFREMSSVAGEINHQISDNKNLMMQILEKYQTMHDLEKSKINLAEYKDLQKKFENDQWLHSIENHLKTSTEFKFEIPVSMTKYVRDSYYGQKAIAITLQKNSITTYLSNVVFSVTDGYNKKPFSQEKKWLKSEKFYELLKDGEWEPKKA